MRCHHLALGAFVVLAVASFTTACRRTKAFQAAPASDAATEFVTATPSAAPLPPADLDCGGAICPAARTAPAAQRALWSQGSRFSVGERGFREDSLLSAELVVIAEDAEATGARYQTVTALDPSTGKTLWTAQDIEQVIHGTGRASPLYLTSRCWPEEEAGAACSVVRPFRELREIAPQTGEILRRIPIGPLDSLNARFYLAGDRILCSWHGGLVALDAASGATAWQVPRPPGAGSTWNAPVVLADRVLLDWDGCAAHSLSDGERLFAVEGCFDPKASPDGTHLLGTLYGARESVAFAADGRILASYPGAVCAVSDRFAVFERIHPPPGGARGFEVVELDGGRKVLALRESSDEEYFSAVTLFGDELFYFHAKDKTLWRHDVARGVRRPVRRLSGGFSIAPDGVGAYAAHLSEPPILAAPYLFVNDRRIEAYRLTPME